MVGAKGFEVSVESSAGLERRLKIRVPSAEIEREIASRLAKVGKTAKLKGFRPGKIPEKVVRKYYGGQVRDEVLSDVIRASYSQAIADQKLNPAGGPRIEAVAGETGKPYVFVDPGGLTAFGFGALAVKGAVSYTHLTLPTILLV